MFIFKGAILAQVPSVKGYDDLVRVSQRIQYISAYGSFFNFNLSATLLNFSDRTLMILSMEHRISRKVGIMPYKRRDSQFSS